MMTLDEAIALLESKRGFNNVCGHRDVLEVLSDDERELIFGADNSTCAECDEKDDEIESLNDQVKSFNLILDEVHHQIAGRPR